MKDLTGKRYGRLVVTKYTNKRTNDGHVLWECKCDCGETALVDTKSLTTGSTSSCGCYRRDVKRRQLTTHGHSRTKLYYVWNDMKSRCTDKNTKPYKDYGGRGICVCQDWRSSFELFMNWALDSGYKEGLSLDRIDVNKGYYPDNCRWVSMKIQSNNKRNNRIITLGNTSHTLSEWSNITGIKGATIRARLNAGWTVEDALSITPIPGGNYGA